MLETTESRLSPVTIHPLEYRAIIAAGLAPAQPTKETSAEPASAEAEALEARIRKLEKELEERTRNFENGLRAARREAFEAGQMSERGEHAARLTAASQALIPALKDFAAARDRYLAQVEQEVVRLALAIAARILRREALMDPLLLTGAVRVALGQLADTTEVRLRVPAAEHTTWCEMLRLMPNLPLHPEVVADASLTTGDCVLETHLGSVDLGVRSQLAEIERGFFDLLEHRERGTAESTALEAEKRSTGLVQERQSGPEAGGPANETSKQ
ncbi:MAG TPA: FliH/SctL family protein [Acidobacteriaceae bacterium]|nr:FliH/SctL family protein [Acidobacteriaceae bacterium]